MYNNNLTIKPAMCLLAAFTLAMVSCQKKFDPKSYAPKETFGGYATSNEVAASDLVAHFAFEGNLVDSVSNTAATNHGTSNGTGIKGQGLLVGLNNYTLFTPTDAIKNLQSFTISFWVNTPINTTGIQEPVCFVNPAKFWSNMDIYFDGQSDATSKLKMHLFNTAEQDGWFDQWSIANPWDKWLHITFTYDLASEKVAFYVNGALVGSATKTGFGTPNFANVPVIVFGTVQFMTDPNLTTGADPQSWASFLLGVMDELRIYKKALSADDVKALYNLENLGK
ncbi:LamG domain-containing protein [Flavitalea sp. BT771]|uniref:LamG domain-containing protein n=1 Tax=Flavitalea sp. BT771 TaxID=3063329 RepID=UPI0026E20270|nr:LamG domain-containing protein [Flavitalea sp. BT771]MDO6433532.1 LamG domain-containing protein [Flavitalea sp. BT771]MDV6222563.1 LamG domain-containing protein [Flavitalea sp. BT771]